MSACSLKYVIETSDTAALISYRLTREFAAKWLVK